MNQDQVNMNHTNNSKIVNTIHKQNTPAGSDDSEMNMKKNLDEKLGMAWP